MAKRKKKKTGERWIQRAIKKPGAFTEWCRRRGYSGVTQACIEEGKRSKDPTTRRRAVLAETLRKISKKRKKRRKK